MKPTTQHNTKRCKVCGYRVRGKNHASGTHHRAADLNQENRRKAVKK